MVKKTSDRISVLYNLANEPVLSEQGWRILTDSTLKCYKKEELIGIIRCLENNWASQIIQTEVIQKRLEQATEYLHSKGYSIEQTNEIMSLKEEHQGEDDEKE